jgi:hypothetical protein
MAVRYAIDLTDTERAALREIFLYRPLFLSHFEVAT